jgi:hypothetical protein
MQDKLKALVQSRRFWVAVAGIITVMGNDLGLFNLTQDHVTNVVLLCASWVVGDSIRKTEVLNP